MGFRFNTQITEAQLNLRAMENKSNLLTKLITKIWLSAVYHICLKQR